MKVKLTEKGKQIVEQMEIPKEVRKAFYSLFPVTSKIDKVMLHYRICALDASTWDEEMCKGVMLVPRPEAYIEAIQEQIILK